MSKLPTYPKDRSYQHNFLVSTLGRDSISRTLFSQRYFSMYKFLWYRPEGFVAQLQISRELSLCQSNENLDLNHNWVIVDINESRTEINAEYNNFVLICYDWYGDIAYMILKNIASDLCPAFHFFEAQNEWIFNYFICWFEYGDRRDYNKNIYTCYRSGGNVPKFFVDKRPKLTTGAWCGAVMKCPVSVFRQYSDVWNSRINSRKSITKLSDWNP